MPPKRAFPEDAKWLAWQRAASEIYEDANYASNAVVAFFNTSGHRLAERSFDANQHFSEVLEVGAGTGYHLRFVQHRFDTYRVTDINPKLLELAKTANAHGPGVQYAIEDASDLSFPDESFDRLISIFNLEHMASPHLILQEWKRVVKKKGTLTIAIPMDGGVAWRLGRYATTRRYFQKRGLDLSYIIAREHVNPAYNLIPLIRRYLDPYREFYFPSRVPLVDLNLIYVCQALKQ